MRWVCPWQNWCHLRDGSCKVVLGVQRIAGAAVDVCQRALIRLHAHVACLQSTSDSRRLAQLGSTSATRAAERHADDAVKSHLELAYRIRDGCKQTGSRTARRHSRCR